jgi:hypothetical protein
MDERHAQPDEPDAVDQDTHPDEDEPNPHREPAEDEGLMRFPGEDAPDVVGSGPDAAVGPGEEIEAPDAVGATDDPL